ncbi:hypothetical protein GTO27_11710, partial [Candidatus Bathyarchaeota archaeon]|nr:hypothetical protein [Candidatus Bathyarchaeota archaeon]
SLDPSLKKKVLEGEINLTQCSRCKEETIVESNLLYNDMDNKLWLQVTLGDEAGWSDEEAKFRNDLKSLKDKHPG